MGKYITLELGNRKLNSVFIPFLILCLLFFYVLNYYYPFMHDDYIYCFIFDEHSDKVIPSADRIQNIGDVLKSQFYHYQYFNGRFISHTIIQIFAGILGKGIFNVINCIMGVIFCIYFSRITFDRYYNYKLILLPIVLLFLSFPYPGQTVFWMTGAINYFWGATLALCVLYVLLKNTKEHHRNVLFSVLAFCAGCMNESVSVPVSGGMVLYFITSRHKLSSFKRLIILLYLLGTMMIVIAPATYLRLNGETDINTSFSILTFAITRIICMGKLFSYYPITFVTLILALYTVFKKKQFLRENILFLEILLTSFMFLLLIRAVDDRIYFFHVILSWIIVIRYLIYSKKYEFIFKYKSAFVLGVLIMFIFNCHNAYSHITYYHHYVESVKSKIKDEGKNCLIPILDYLKEDSKFTYMTVEPIYNPLSIHNRVKALFYEKNYFVPYPIEVYDFIINDKESVSDYVLHEHNISNKYIIYSTNNLNIKTVKFNVIKDNARYSENSVFINLKNKLRDISLSRYKPESNVEENVIVYPIIYNNKTYFYIPYTNKTKIEKISIN